MTRNGQFRVCFFIHYSSPAGHSLTPPCLQNAGRLGAVMRIEVAGSRALKATVSSPLAPKPLADHEAIVYPARNTGMHLAVQHMRVD